MLDPFQRREFEKDQEQIIDEKENEEKKEAGKKEDYISVERFPEEDLESFAKRIIETKEKEKERVVVIFDDNLFEFLPCDGETPEKILEEFNRSSLLSKSLEKEKEWVEERLMARKSIFDNNPELLDIYNNYLNLSERSNQENKQKEVFDYKRYPFHELGNAIRQSLPEIPNDYVRLWRGCRENEFGYNPQYTNSLEGIALPFLRFYKGFLSYIDVPKEDVLKYLSGGAPGAEFFLPKELVRNARLVGFNTEREKEIKEKAKPLEELQKQEEDNVYGF